MPWKSESRSARYGHDINRYSDISQQMLLKALGCNILVSTFVRHSWRNVVFHLIKFCSFTPFWQLKFLLDSLISWSIRISAFKQKLYSISKERSQYHRFREFILLQRASANPDLSDSSVNPLQESWPRGWKPLSHSFNSFLTSGFFFHFRDFFCPLLNKKNVK